ncbi:MAG TPA: MBL fold metallo-hydrolase [Gammaproteobacteria bacterium]
MNRFWHKIVAALLLWQAVAIAHALEIEKVTDNVYALVGEMGQRSAENLGNNATFGVVVTSEGVVLIDSGASWKGAQRIEEAIRTITDQPVKLVINSGGQDHRWLGNGYFKAKGARIIASNAAIEDQHKRAAEQLTALAVLVGERGMADTQPLQADEGFDGTLEITLGATTLQLIHAGPAHTPGDALVWLPAEQVVFTGDVVYVERLLGVMPYSSSRHWLTAFDMIAALKPRHLVPGHGHVTTLAQAKAETYDYLVMLRDQVGELIASGSGMERAGQIEQSAFSYLQAYDELKGRNSQQVYGEMEWE